MNRIRRVLCSAAFLAFAAWSAAADGSRIPGTYAERVKASGRSGTAVLSVSAGVDGFDVTRTVTFADGASESLSGVGRLSGAWLNVTFPVAAGVVERLSFAAPASATISASFLFYGDHQVLGRLSNPSHAGGWSTAEDRGKAAVVEAERISAAGLPNLARIAPGIYRGAQPTDEGYAWLQAHGFKTVINLRSWHDEEAKVAAHGMKSVSIPLEADLFGSRPPSEAQLRQFFRVVVDPANQPVYFHCAQGKDRTGTMAAIYRMEIDGWSNAEAMREMDHFGFHHLWHDLHEFVEDYRPRGTFAPVH